MTRKINVAIIGIGSMGATHTRAAQASPFINSETIIGYEPDPERAKLRGTELNIRYTSNLDDILNDKSIELAYIASVNEVHVDQAIACMQAGKAVLCEKPMGIGLEECRRVMKTQVELDAFLQIGFELRYSPLYQFVKDAIVNGAIGKPLNCHCRYYCSEFHKKNTWRVKSEGSLIGEKLSHYLDLPRWWFDDEVTEVYSMGAPNFVKYFNHPDNHQISYKFKGGGVSQLNFIMGVAETDEGDPLLDLLEKQKNDGHELTYMIYGEKGAIQTDVFNRRIRRWEFTDGPEQLVSKLVETITFDPKDDNKWFHNTHQQNIRISELVANGMGAETTAADSFETMKLCFAADLSQAEGRIVKISEFN